MKRFLSLLLVVAMIVSLSLCCVTTASAEKNDKSGIDITELISKYGKYFTADNVTALVSAFNEIKENGISLDTDTAAVIVSGLANYVDLDIGSLDPAVIKVVVNAAASAYENGIEFDGSTITAIAAGLAGQALGGLDIGSLDPALVTAVIKGLSDIKLDGLTLDSDTVSLIVSALAAKALEGTDFNPDTVAALIKAIADVKANGFDLSSDAIQAVIKQMVGNETYAEIRTIICNVTGNYPFTDIAASGYRDSITEAYYMGLVSGFADGTYKPNQAVTRAQFVTLLWRAAGEPAASGTLKFSDSSKISSSYKAAVIWGVKNGVIAGYSDNTFRPNQNISRAQMATFMYRYMKNVEGYNFGTVKTMPFTDCGSLNASFRTAIAAMYSEGIMNGISNTKFNPNGTANRGMAAAVILRMYKVLEG